MSEEIKKEREPIRHNEVRSIKTDARYRVSAPATIANESFSHAIGIRGAEIIEQLLDVRIDEEGRVIITNYDLGFEIPLSVGIKRLTDEDLFEIVQIRQKYEEKNAKQEFKKEKSKNLIANEEAGLDEVKTEEDTSNVKTQEEDAVENSGKEETKSIRTLNFGVNKK